MRRAAKLPLGWFYCANCAIAHKESPRRKPGTQRFCSGNCRKEYHKYGGISVHRLKDDTQKWVRQVIQPLQEAVSDLISRVQAVEASNARAGLTDSMQASQEREQRFSQKRSQTR